MKFEGTVIKYGDNVDTDVIIPARYLNTSDKKELASHCMEDLDTTFSGRVKQGDIMVAGFNFGCGSSREHAPIAIKESGISLVIALREFSTETLSISVLQYWNARKQLTLSRKVILLKPTLTRVSLQTKLQARNLKQNRSLNLSSRS